MKVILKDKTEADALISLTENQDGTVSGTFQKIVLDDDDDFKANDGDPVEFTLSEEDAQAVEDVLVPIITPYVSPNAGGTGSAAKKKA